MNRVISFYMWVGSSLLYLLLLTLFLLIPVRSFFMGELTGDQVTGTVLIGLSFGPLCYVWLRFCNYQLKVMETKWIALVFGAPFGVVVVIGLLSLIWH